MENNDKQIQVGDGRKKRGDVLKDFASFVGILAVAGLLAVLLINFVFRSYAVDGPSMETTLQNQDKLIVWKVPVTLAKLTGNPYIPHRGDIIIANIEDLSACGQSGEKQIIKRTLGLPGDRVVVKDGKLTIYNDAQPNGFSPDDTLPYNEDNRIPYTDNEIDVTLDEGQIFIAGDNRPDSCDSRRFGPINSDQIVGKLIVRLLPANNIKLF
jgi:signal peptidase I